MMFICWSLMPLREQQTIGAADAAAEQQLRAKPAQDTRFNRKTNKQAKQTQTQ